MVFSRRQHFTARHQKRNVSCRASSIRILLRTVFGRSLIRRNLITTDRTEAVVELLLLPLQATFCPQQTYMVEGHLVSNTPSVTESIVGFCLFYIRHQIRYYTVHLVFISNTAIQMDYVSIGDLYTNSDFR